jgi:hypothetical protein
VLVLLAFVLLGAAVVGGSRALADPASPGTCPSGSGLDTGSLTLTATPTGTSDHLGTHHTVTATLTDSQNRPFSGACLLFDARAGSPSQGWPYHAQTAQDGTATVTWTSYTTGTDTVDVKVFDFSDTVIAQDTVTQTWTQPASGLGGKCPPGQGPDAFGLSAGPTGTSSHVGSSHTVTAHADSGEGPQPGACIQFDQQSGPSTGWPRHLFADGNGNASVTWSSNKAGKDVIVVSDVNSDGVKQHSTPVDHTWTSTTPQPTGSPGPFPTFAFPPLPSASPTESSSPAAPTTSPSPTTSPTASPTPTATESPTSSPSPAPAPTGFDSGSIELDSPSALPGGTATVNGRNCPAGTVVTFTVEGQQAGSSTTQPDGTFGGEVQLPNASIGTHVIVVTCAGLTASVPIDLVVSSSTSTPGASATAGAVMVFFLLFGLLMFARTSSPAARPAVAEDPEDA